MLIELNENGYLTGNYAIIGGNPDWTEVESLPDEDHNRIPFYKYIGDNKYEFDQELYDAHMENIANHTLEKTKAYLIDNSKILLDEYLSENKLESSCHKGIPAYYTITKDKQNYLETKIKAAESANDLNINHSIQYNAAGQIATDDWTLSELKQLQLEISVFIDSLVLKQQQYESAINAATSIEELYTIKIEY